jgi:predicted transcriptional regulator
MAETQTLYGFEIREPDSRRVDAEERKTYDIKQLWQRSHEIIGLALLGHKETEIAELLNITPQCVSNTLNSSLGKEKLSKMREKRDENVVDLSKRIAELTNKAMDVYEEIFNNEGADLKLKKETADTVVMEIAGHRAATKIDTRSFNFNMSPDDLDAFKKRGLAAAKASGMIVEVDQKPKEINNETVVD